MVKTAVDEDIAALSRAVLSDAQADADQIVSEAREKAQATLQRAREQAEQERQNILARAKEEADRLRGQSLATTQLKSRTMLLEHREKLLEEVFHTAQKDLSGIQQWSDYEEIAKELFDEAIQQIDAPEVEVRSDPHTQSLLTPSFLQQYAEEHQMKIKVGEPLDHELGTIVQTMDGHLMFDNTLHARLHRMKNEMRAQIYHRLMGEAA